MRLGSMNAIGAVKMRPGCEGVVTATVLVMACGFVLVPARLAAWAAWVASASSAVRASTTLLAKSCSSGSLPNSISTLARSIAAWVLAETFRVRRPIRRIGQIAVGKAKNAISALQ